ncbi:glycosyltransferase family 2 protein [Pedobacter sp. HMF7647]|uniref:Glycosyltransferase family 2 protein n=1 Tax=Hufsiella arboris TaxID=2695275 RepID=A0A7K1Y614_9SPHI|nr:glycosyltransferase family 2 protein [Hufsiella arboris]MXV50017.1 glycosyltransferase family 2 protein [Hufsiella arboris]
MKVSGFTFIRNAVKNDYPIVEAITSILPLCDEFIVAHGNSEDNTRELIEAIGSPKIKIVETVWNDDVRDGGKTFALETDKAFAAISKDSNWAFYIQGDECVHEQYLPLIKSEMEQTLNDPKIEGLLFRYKHFYGSYDYFAFSRRWYRKEIRIVKNLPGVHSYRDAQGFRIDDRKIRVKEIDAYIYHYGWVKPPSSLNHKVRNFNKFYQEDQWIENNYPVSDTFDYGNADRLIKFEESYPQVMSARIEKSNWKFSFDPTTSKNKNSFRRRLLEKIFVWTGIRIGEYKNYEKVK